MDRLSDALYATLDDREQGRLLREAAEILATDVPVIPLYFRTSFAAVRTGIRALDDYAGTQGSGAMARNAHLWDRD
jgi:ABC-type transport system substrate-binding protein